MSSHTGFLASGFREEIGRVIGAEDLRLAVAIEPPPHLPDRICHAHQVLRRNGAPAHDVFRADGLDLAVEVFAAVGRLGRERRPVPGGRHRRMLQI